MQAGRLFRPSAVQLRSWERSKKGKGGQSSQKPFAEAHHGGGFPGLFLNQVHPSAQNNWLPPFTITSQKNLSLLFYYDYSTYTVLFCWEVHSGLDGSLIPCTSSCTTCTSALEQARPEWPKVTQAQPSDGCAALLLLYGREQNTLYSLSSLITLLNLSLLM